MTTQRILATIIFTCFSFTSFAQRQNDSTALLNRPADVGLIYPISTNGVNAARYNNNFSLQALAGVSGAITGAAFAGIANIIKDSLYGGAFAGIANISGDHAKGGQFAGIINSVKNKSTGLQAAGLLNKSGNIKGLQIAGLGNVTRKGDDGVQIAGLFNRADNIHTQMAGLINKAGKVNGVQISGLINIADSSDYPIGIINIIKNGERSIGVSTDETMNALLSFRSGGRVLYGIIGIGYNLESEYDLFALETGIGAHLLSFNNHFRINTEATQLTQTGFKGGHSFKYALRVLAEIKINRRLELFAGPTTNLLVDYSHGKTQSLINHYVWTSTGRNGHFLGSYIGVAGGINFIL